MQIFFWQNSNKSSMFNHCVTLTAYFVQNIWLEEEEEEEEEGEENDKDDDAIKPEWIMKKFY